MPVNVIGTLKPKNNGKFPVAEAVDIKVTDNQRLDEALENKADLSSVNFALAGKANASDFTTSTANLQGQIDQIAQTAGTGTADTEIGQARVGADGTSYQTLKGRLDSENDNHTNSERSIIYKVEAVSSELNTIVSSAQNLYLPNEVTERSVMTKSGEVQENASYCYTGFIPVTQGDVIAVKRYDTNTYTSMRFVAAYDENENVITSSGAESITSYTVPVGVRYVIITFTESLYDADNTHKIAILSNYNYNGPFIPAGETFREIDGELLSTPISTITNEINSNSQSIEAVERIVQDISVLKTRTSNIEDIVDVVEGEYVDKSGAIVTNNSYHHTNIINVTEGDTVESSNIRFVTAYSGEDAIAASGAENVTNYTVPAGIDGVIITTYSTYTFGKITQSFVESVLADAVTELENTTHSLSISDLPPETIHGITRVGHNYAKEAELLAEEKYAYGEIGSRPSYSDNVNYDIIILPVEVGSKYTITQSGTGSIVRFEHGIDEDGIIVYSDNQTSANYVFNNSESVGASKLMLTIVHGKIGDTIIQKDDIPPIDRYNISDEWNFEKTVHPELHAYLPKEIPIAVGRTVEIYNEQVCLEADKYHIQWDCQVGKALKRKFSIEGISDIIGSYTLTCRIYDDSKSLIWTASTTLKIVNGLDTNYSCVPIGDSLTNNKRWSSEVINLSGGNISYLGHYAASITDADGIERSFHHEGRSGFTSAGYLNGAPYTYGGGDEPEHNVFWNPAEERFDWNYYKNNVSVNPDFVQIFLGTNELREDNTDPAQRIKQIVDLIRQDDGSIPIFVVNTIYFGNQNGIGVQRSSDGFSTAQRGMWKYLQDCKVMDLMIKLDSALENEENVYMINLAITHDSEYNFGAVETPVNPRAAQTELMPTEAVHPQSQGYFQMADTIYSAYCAYLGE